jgi:hypothetical protein
LHALGRDHDGRSGGSSEHDLSSEQGNTNRWLRSERQLAEAGTGVETGTDLDLGW